MFNLVPNTSQYMSPVSTVFHTVVTVSIAQKRTQNGNIHSKILDVLTLGGLVLVL